MTIHTACLETENQNNITSVKILLFLPPAGISAGIFLRNEV
jgi:hypothetical protein